MEIIINAILFCSTALFLLFNGAELGAHILIPVLGYKKEATQKVLSSISKIWQLNLLLPAIPLIILFLTLEKSFQLLLTYFAPAIFLLILLKALQVISFIRSHYFQSSCISILIAFIIGSIGSLWGQLSINFGSIGFFFVVPNYFNILSGIFVVFLFIYTGSLFLLQEHNTGKIKGILINLINKLIIILMLLGVLLFSTLFYISDFPLGFLMSSSSLLSMGLATILVIIQFILIKQNKFNFLKTTSSVQFLLIISGLVMSNSNGVISLYHLKSESIIASIKAYHHSFSDLPLTIMICIITAIFYSMVFYKYYKETRR